MSEQARFQYPSSISDIVQVNDQFDRCVLTVCYTGTNRNGSSISKSAIENALPTMAYCPIVANYSIEDDTIGGHDMKIVRRSDGQVKLVNLTTPLGVIPEHPHVFWREIEDGGTSHEYLCVDALVWKRSAVYEKLIADGITSQSMEIDVFKAHDSHGIHVIDEFQFTAFAVIGVEPCFESASVAFSQSTDDMHEMLADFKAEFAMEAAGNIESERGGTYEMEEKLELLAEFSLKLEDLDFNIEEFSVEELREKFVALSDEIKRAEEGVIDDDGLLVGPKSGPAPMSEDEEDPESGDDPNAGEEPDIDDTEDEEDHDPEDFALTTNQFMEELCRVVGTVTIKTEWGECQRYYVHDCDMEAGRAICMDRGEHDECWMLVGIPYTVDGDMVIVNFEAAKRVKVVYEDFECDCDEPSKMAEFVKNEFSSIAKFYQSEMETVRNEMSSEIAELKQFKAGVEEAARNAAVEAVFEKFAILNGNELFENLKVDCADMSVEEIEDRCYAIKGRTEMSFSAKHSVKSVVLPVGDDKSDEPYGGVVNKYLSK